MAVEVTRTVDGSDVTYNIAITAEQSLIDLLASEAGECIYNTTPWIRSAYGGVDWSTLTNPQKMHVIGLYVQRKLRTIGYSGFYRNEAEAIDDIDAHYGGE